MSVESHEEENGTAKEKKRLRVNRLTDVRPTKVSVVHRGANRSVLICKSAEDDMPDEFGNMVVELTDVDIDTQPTETPAEEKADEAPADPAAEPATETDAEKADVIAKPVQPKVLEAVTSAVEKLKSLVVRVKGMAGTDDKVAKPIPAAVEQEIKSIAASLVATAEKYPAPKSDGDEPAPGEKADGDTEPAAEPQPEPTAKTEGDDPPADEPTEKAEMPNPVKAKVVEVAGSAIGKLIALADKVKGMQTSDEKLPLPGSVEQALRSCASLLKGLLEKYPGTQAQVAGDVKPEDEDKKGDGDRPPQLSAIERAAAEIEKAAVQLDGRDMQALRKLFSTAFKIMQKLDPKALEKEGIKVSRQPVKKSEGEELGELKAKLAELEATITEQREQIAKMDNPMPEARSASTGWEAAPQQTEQRQRMRQGWQPGAEEAKPQETKRGD